MKYNSTVTIYFENCYKTNMSLHEFSCIMQYINIVIHNNLRYIIANKKVKLIYKIN